MNFSIGLSLTIIAGLSTLIGILPIFINVKKINEFISCSLSFSSGVMFSVSLFDLLPESINSFKNNFPLVVCFIIFILLFFAGFLLSKLISERINIDNKLYKVGVVAMISIVMHNIPEGILTFIATSINKDLGISLAIMIALHNIPEGIAITIPIYYSTNSKLKAFIYVLISALSEPVGALLSFFFFYKLINPILLGIMFSIVCGIMIYISIFELLKESRRYLFFVIGIIFIFVILKI